MFAFTSHQEITKCLLLPLIPEITKCLLLPVTNKCPFLSAIRIPCSHSSRTNLYSDWNVLIHLIMICIWSICSHYSRFHLYSHSYVLINLVLICIWSTCSHSFRSDLCLNHMFSFVSFSLMTTSLLSPLIKHTSHLLVIFCRQATGKKCPLQRKCPTFLQKEMSVSQRSHIYLFPRLVCVIPAALLSPLIQHTIYLPIIWCSTQTFCLHSEVTHKLSAHNLMQHTKCLPVIWYSTQSICL